ncbi:hypothetical protein QJQ45_009050 [Haematococcus lacustris]|nr:hypothetical protein QJQ45_009050 [Haematococcus lacustris]
MQRPLELCSCEGFKALPPVGKEYQQGYKRVSDRLPRVRQRLHRAAEYQRHAKYDPPPSPTPPQAPHAQAPPPPPAQAQPLAAAPGPVPRPQAPPGGRWLDQDTNGYRNFQRIGESMQHPLELCSYEGLEALPPIGKEYRQRYKRVNDRLPKGIAEQREFVFDPAIQQFGVGIDPGVTQAVRAASGIRSQASWKLTKGPGTAAAEAVCSPGPLKQFFKQLQKDMEEVSMERHGSAKQLVVFFGAASICTRGGWGADAVLRACCKVVCRPRGSDQLRGRVVLVDEYRTTRWPPASPHRPHAAARKPHRQQPQSQGPALPLQQKSKRTEAEQAAEPTQPTKAEQAAELSKGKEYPGLCYKRI